jgi:hypothetical protein
MAYDRYDTRNAPRDERSRWSDDRDRSREGGSRDDRGFFERAGDEIASWFGDDEAERRRRQDNARQDRESGWGSPERSSQRDWDRDRMSSHRDHDRDHDWHRDEGRERSFFGGRHRDEGDWNQRGENRSWGREMWGGGGRDRERDRERSFGSDRDRGYRPMTGDYGRSEREMGSYDRDRPSEWSRDPYRSSSRAGTSDRSDRSRHDDPHYDSWRQRHMSELDRDYDDYRRENRSKFEDDFASWRTTRQQKRGLLGQIREHMEVVGNDQKHVGKVDKVAGDRIILTKSDPESGGVHHSLSCSDIDRVEGDRVILDCSADQARNRWRDESRSRALFEREDSGEMGPRMLDRSFEGTYRR